MPEPVSRYQPPEAASTSTPASFQSPSSALWVPLSSPREAKGASAAAIFTSAATASAMPATPAGSEGGPTMTKSLYITSKRATPSPSATNFSSAVLACTKRTSPSPFAAFLIACPVPTATTRTSIPVFPVNVGRMWSKRPEFRVDVVDWTTMNLSGAAAGPAAAKPAATVKPAGPNATTAALARWRKARPIMNSSFGVRNALNQAMDSRPRFREDVFSRE